ncbi:MAG TPA: Hsp20/alpha crystallin family protein [Rubricoccaceae bacterium]|jgi:HSP20 family protein
MASFLRPVAGDLNGLRREMDSLFQAMMPTSENTAVWSPRADIVEVEGEYHVALDVPGVDPASLDVTLAEGVLTISGERTLRDDFRNGRFHRVERSYGRFARAFRLGPDADAEAVEADYDSGVLFVTVRKAEASRPRRIEIRTARSKQIEPANESVNTTDAVEA